MALSGPAEAGAEAGRAEAEVADEISRGLAQSRDRDAAFAPARLGELQRSVLDASLAHRELGWQPRRPLADGLSATWDWISAQ